MHLHDVGKMDAHFISLMVQTNPIHNADKKG